MQLKIGIVGSGQLAKYLFQSIKKLDHLCLILVEENQEILFQADEVFTDPTEFLKAVDIYSFENEFFDLTKLNDPASQKAFPSLQAMSLSKNKIAQKKLIESLEIPSSPMRLLSEFQNPNAFLAQVKWDFKDSLMLKRSQGSYDGYGNYKVQKSTSLEALLKWLEASSCDVYAEKMVDFEDELALVFCALNGEVKNSYPLFLTQQLNSCCYSVEKHQNQELKNEMLIWAEKISHQLNYTGVMAIEAFLEKDGTILFNELAPRVHNSGHLSLDSHDLSQFDLHILCGIAQLKGLENFQPELEELFSHYKMFNLLGDGIKDYSQLQSIQNEDFSVYNYTKKINRVGRKMGHVNFFSQSVVDFNKQFENWEKNQWSK